MSGVEGFHDYTLATPFERLVSAIEQSLLSWAGTGLDALAGRLSATRGSRQEQPTTSSQVSLKHKLPWRREPYLLILHLPSQHLHNHRRGVVAATAAPGAAPTSPASSAAREAGVGAQTDAARSGSSGGGGQRPLSAPTSPSGQDAPVSSHQVVLEPSPEDEWSDAQSNEGDSRRDGAGGEEPSESGGNGGGSNSGSDSDDDIREGASERVIDAERQPTGSRDASYSGAAALGGAGGAAAGALSPLQALDGQQAAGSRGGAAAGGAPSTAATTSSSSASSSAAAAAVLRQRGWWPHSPLAPVTSWHAKAAHKIQKWFGVDAFLLLAPASYSKRFLKQQEATTLLSAATSALHHCRLPLPVFVPVHDALRDAYWGAAHVGGRVLRFDTDSVHISSLPRGLSTLEGQLETLASQALPYCPAAAAACHALANGPLLGPRGGAAAAGSSLVASANADCSGGAAAVAVTLSACYTYKLPPPEALATAASGGNDSASSSSAAAARRRSEDSDGGAVLWVTSWDDGAPWQPWAAQEDPISVMELDLIWEGLPVDHANVHSCPHIGDAATWRVYALQRGYSQSERRGFGLRPVERKRRHVELTRGGADWLWSARNSDFWRRSGICPPAGTGGEADFGAAAAAGEADFVMSPGSFTAMLSVLLTARSAAQHARTLGDMLSPDWWAQHSAAVPPVPPEAVLQDVLRDLFASIRLPGAFGDFTYEWLHDGDSGSAPCDVGGGGSSSSSANIASGAGGTGGGGIGESGGGGSASTNSSSAHIPFRGTAPLQSLFARLALHCCVFGNARAISLLWQRFTRELRFSHWEALQPLPRMADGSAAGALNHNGCLVYQKLQMLNACIAYLRNSAAASRTDAAASKDAVESSSSAAAAVAVTPCSNKAAAAAAAAAARRGGTQPVQQQLSTLAATRGGKALASSSADPQGEEEEEDDWSDKWDVRTPDFVAVTSARTPGTAYYSAPGTIGPEGTFLDDDDANEEEKEEAEEAAPAQRMGGAEGSWVQGGGDATAPATPTSAPHADAAAGGKPGPQHAAPSAATTASPTDLPPPRGVSCQMTPRLCLLSRPGVPINVPLTQPPPLYTSDMLIERDAALTALGPDNKILAAEGDAMLASDMAAFKAANPGAAFVDFLCWHSPADVEIDTKGRRNLSPRMASAGNAWQTLWAATAACPACRQRPLMDWRLQGERCLHYLETLAPGALFTQLFGVSLAAALALLGACPGAAIPGMQHLLTRHKAMVTPFVAKASGLSEFWADHVQRCVSDSALQPSSSSSSSPSLRRRPAAPPQPPPEVSPSGLDDAELEFLLSEFRYVEQAAVMAESLCRRLPGCPDVCASVLANCLGPGAAPPPPPPQRLQQQQQHVLSPAAAVGGKGAAASRQAASSSSDDSRQGAASAAHVAGTSAAAPSPGCSAVLAGSAQKARLASLLSGRSCPLPLSLPPGDAAARNADALRSNQAAPSSSSLPSSASAPADDSSTDRQETALRRFVAESWKWWPDAVQQQWVLHCVSEPSSRLKPSQGEGEAAAAPQPSGGADGKAARQRPPTLAALAVAGSPTAAPADAGASLLHTTSASSATVQRLFVHMASGEMRLAVSTSTSATTSTAVAR